MLYKLIDKHLESKLDVKKYICNLPKIVLLTRANKKYRNLSNWFYLQRNVVEIKDM